MTGPGARTTWAGAGLLVTVAAVHVAFAPWALAAGALLFACRPRSLELRRDGDLQRQLMLCRRRGETADILVVRCPSPPVATSIAHALRVTDGTEVLRDRRAVHVAALLHDAADRAEVERRLRERVAGAEIAFGWAAFPADGVTLDTLLHHASLPPRGRPIAYIPADQAIPRPVEQRPAAGAATP